MSVETPDFSNYTKEELLRENQALRSKVSTLQQEGSYYWELYAETSRKLQVYSASIKAAVSSLLNYDIFWDSANEHEFLETINSSVSQVSELIILLTLAFRAEAGSLTIKRDPHALPEILSLTATNARLKLPGLNLDFRYPGEGKPVLVDYEYLSLMLLLLIEVIKSRVTSEIISLTAVEEHTDWVLDFSGFDATLMKLIEEMHQCKTQPTGAEFLSPENVLRLHIACEIAHLQEIAVEVLEQQAGHPPILRLWVPAIMETQNQ